MLKKKEEKKTVKKVWLRPLDQRHSDIATAVLGHDQAQSMADRSNHLASDD